MGVMNLGTYGFTLAAARLLGPREYGAVAAVMGLMLVLGTLSLGFQATAARRVSTDETHAEAELLRSAEVGALGLAVATLLAAPLVSTVLRLDSWWSAVLLAAAVLPLTLMGGFAGIFQGEGRWRALAAVYVGVGAGRLLLGLAGMLAWRSAEGALLGVAAGNLVPAAIGWWCLRRRGRADVEPTRPRGSLRPVLTEVLHDCHALLAFFAMSNVDVIIARRMLSEHEAGLYAAGLIMAKAVLFLPQFVVVLAFPTMVRERRSRMQLQALLLVLAIGVLATAAAWLLAPLAVLFVGGDAYAALEPTIWAFAGIGGLLAMIQLVGYGSMARQHRAAVALLWGGLGVLLLAGLAVSSTTELLVTVATVHATVLLGLVLTLVLVGRRALPRQ